MPQDAGCPAGFIGHIAHIDPSLEVGTGSQNHLFCTEYRTQGSDNPGHFPVFGEQFHNFRLFEGQVLLKLHLVLHILGVGRTVDLSPEGMHRRSLTPVEHPALEEGRIGSLAHFAAQSIDFPHQMSLGGTARWRGLQGILATASSERVNSMVLHPRRAAARAASTPA